MSDNYIEFDSSDNKFPVFSPGIYKFEVKVAEKKLSKAGKPMIQLTLSCWQGTDAPFTMFDWLTPSFPPKIKGFCETTGMIKKFLQSRLSDIDCMGKTGNLNLIVEESNGKKRNAIKEYCSDAAEDFLLKAEKMNKPQEHGDRNPPPFVDDEIPF